MLITFIRVIIFCTIGPNTVAIKIIILLEQNEDDETAQEELEACDDVFFENEEEINRSLEECAAKIEQ